MTKLIIEYNNTQIDCWIDLGFNPCPGDFLKLPFGVINQIKMKENQLHIDKVRVISRLFDGYGQLIELHVEVV